MDEPIRLTVLKALTAHLEGIVHSVGEDWDGFNLAGRVYRGISRYGAEMGEEEFLSILEAPRPDAGITTGVLNSSRVEEWPLLLQGWTKDDKTNPSDPVYRLMNVVELRLKEIVAVHGRTGMPIVPSKYLLGNLITSFSFGPGVVRPPTEGISSKAFFYLPLRVGLATVV